jgi:membrane fusion protein (multidrug efflux system)
MKRVAIFTIVFLLLAGIIGGFAYFQFSVKPKMIEQFMSAGGFPPVTISATEAKADSWVPRLPAIGSFEAVQGIELAPQLGGVIRALHFDSSQVVEAGQLLVELDDEVEQADLKSGLAQLQEANLSLGRQRELFQKGNTSQASLDASIASRDTAAATVERSRALIDQKAIAAPFAGVLGIRLVDLGDYVSPGTPLVTLQQLDPIYVDFPVPERDIARVRVGQTVEILADAYPDELYTGRIEFIDTRIQQDTRDVLVRVSVANEDRRLLPGMFANVNVLAGTAQPVVTIPRTAISYSLYGDSVYVVVPAAAPESAASDAATDSAADPATADAAPAQPQLVVERRFVVLGETRDGIVAVAEGIEAGEMVVTSGQIKLRPGATVVIDNSISLDPPAVRPEE